MPVFTKDTILLSMTRSNRVLGNGEPVIGKVVLPDVEKLNDMTVDQMRNLRMEWVNWRVVHPAIATLGFKLSDGQGCSAGDFKSDLRLEFREDVKIRIV